MFEREVYFVPQQIASLFAESLVAS